MNEQKTLDYARIAQAIGYIRENFKRQPGLDEIAGEVALSTAHFQRMFTEWAGISLRGEKRCVSKFGRSENI